MILECFVRHPKINIIQMNTEIHGITEDDIESARELRVVQRLVLERLFLAKRIIGVNLDFHFRMLNIDPAICVFLEGRCVDIGLIYTPRREKTPINFRCLHASREKDRLPGTEFSQMDCDHGHESLLVEQSYL